MLTFAGIDPVAYVYAMSSGSGVLGFAESEILFNAGTEVVLENERPLLTSQAYAPTVMPAAPTAEAQSQLQAFVKTLPFRTTTKGCNKPSDLTNLVFVGSPEALERAFAAAGWLPTDELTASSTFKTIKTVSGNSTYTQAPMPVLLLDERPPLFGLSKTTNTFASRHHIRVFPTTKTRGGQTVLTASSTQDIGIAFSRKQKTFIHVIDEHIDNERSKVVNDLVFTGCVSSLDMVNRPWVPRDAYNSTGDRLLTDGEAAVLVINDCQSPRTRPHTIAKPAGVFNLGLKNIGLIKASFDFGNTPPLDGGGIFHIGLQYGVGVKYRVTPRMMLRADWRGTWAKNPNIIANRYEDYEDPDLDDTYSTELFKVGPGGEIIKDRYTLGVAFTF